MPQHLTKPALWRDDDGFCLFANSANSHRGLLRLHSSLQRRHARRPAIFLTMSGINLNSWSENATRLQMRLQETLSEHTKDFALTRASSATYFDAGEDKVKNIGRQLDSNSDREKLDAMKRLIAVRMFLLSSYTVHVVDLCFDR